MGVNFKAMKYVINYGPPRDMDGFVQQFGRAGRDGGVAMAILLFNGKQCRKLDEDMKTYVLNEETCRREIILSAYKSNPSPKRIPICVVTFVRLNVPVKAVTVQMLCTHSLSTRYQFYSSDSDTDFDADDMLDDTEISD